MSDCWPLRLHRRCLMFAGSSATSAITSTTFQRKCRSVHHLPPHQYRPSFPPIRLPKSLLLISPACRLAHVGAGSDGAVSRRAVPLLRDALPSPAHALLPHLHQVPHPGRLGPPLLYIRTSPPAASSSAHPPLVCHAMVVHSRTRSSASTSERARPSLHHPQRPPPPPPSHQTPSRPSRSAALPQL